MQWGTQTQPPPVQAQPPQPPYPATAQGPGGYGATAGQHGAAAYGPGWPPGPEAGVAAPVRPRSAPGPWAWAVALSPILLLGLATLVAALVGVSASVSQCLLAGALVTDAFAIYAAHRDARSLRAAGEPVSGALAWWPLLVPWAYLWARAVKRVNKSGADWGLLGGAVATWLLVIVIASPVIGSATTTGETFNRAQVQTTIAKGIKNQLGATVTVSCPKDPPLNPGSQFQCVATTADGSTTLVTVTIQDRSGDYLWQTAGG